MKKVTIIIPVYNAETTIKYVFDSLESQDNKELVDKVIFINDNSHDSSLKLLNEYKTVASYEILIINHDRNFGLAYNYNEGISKCNTNLFILMHQDMFLENKNSINFVVSELENSDRDVVAVIARTSHPLQVFKEYNFWQKCLFSRLINRKIVDLMGKFDGFKKDLMMKHEILFNSDIYRTAGEDGDIKIKFSKNNLKIKKIDLTVIHIHNKSKNFGLKDWIKKESQLSEYYGVLVRKQSLSLMEFLMISFRPILVILLFVPIINLFDVILILIYSFLYTKHVYIYERKNPRILILPFVNIGLLFIASFYYFKGFVYGKQRI